MHEQEVVRRARESDGGSCSIVFDVIIIIVIRHGRRLYREIKRIYINIYKASCKYK